MTRAFKAESLEQERHGFIWRLTAMGRCRCVDEQRHLLNEVMDALPQCSHEVRDDKEVMMLALAEDGMLLEHASDALKSDPEVVGAAVVADGEALQFASRELRGNKAMVLKAVKLFACGHVLQFASEELRGDPEVVLQAMQARGEPMRYASPELRSNKEFVLKAAALAGDEVLPHVGEDFRGDREVVLAALESSSQALEYASIALQNDREVVLKALRQQIKDTTQYISVLSFAGEELRSDQELVLEAMRCSGRGLRYASSELKSDKDFVLLASRTAPDGKVCYDQAHPIVKAAISSSAFEEVMRSPLACRGETSPVLTVALTEDRERICSASDSDTVDEGVSGCFNCDITMLSGANFLYRVPNRPSVNINKLAQKLVKDLPNRFEVTPFKTVYLVFLKDDGREPVPVTPWDWRRPLSDFLYNSS